MDKSAAGTGALLGLPAPPHARLGDMRVPWRSRVANFAPFSVGFRRNSLNCFTSLLHLAP